MSVCVCVGGSWAGSADSDPRHRARNINGKGTQIANTAAENQGTLQGHISSFRQQKWEVTQPALLWALLARLRQAFNLG